jgi:hypothetical protein
MNEGTVYPFLQSVLRIEGDVMGIDARWLVIEDDEDLIQSLEKLDVQPFLAKGFAEAIVAMRSHPYHCISFDLNLPRNSKDAHLSRQFGLDLLGLMLPMVKKVVFTGFRSSEEGLNTLFKGGKDDFWVLSKGGQNKVEGMTATATPLGWTALMLHFLGLDGAKHLGGLANEAQKFLHRLEETNRQATLPWARSYWQQGVRYLPQPLAEAAQRYNEAVKPLPPPSSDVELSREGLLALNDFREWALWFAAAQTAVLLRQQGKLKSALRPDGSEGTRVAHDWVDQQLAQLAALPPQAPGALAWRNHLGMYTRTDGKHQAWESKALSASEVLRKLRNEGVHGLKPKQWAESAVRDLGDLMDMASFWANCPLLTQVRREGGRWRARALLGKEHMDMDLPKQLKAPATGLDPERVYQLLWWFPADSPAAADEALRLGEPQPVLVDWWPYLRGAFNTHLGAREWVLLTQPDRGGSGDRWLAQALNGSFRKPTLTPAERQALTQADA